jgi:hypothetical protein
MKIMARKESQTTAPRGNITRHDSLVVLINIKNKNFLFFGGTGS